MKIFSFFPRGLVEIFEIQFLLTKATFLLIFPRNRLIALFRDKRLSLYNYPAEYATVLVQATELSHGYGRKLQTADRPPFFSCVETSPRLAGLSPRSNRKNISLFRNNNDETAKLGQMKI